MTHICCSNLLVIGILARSEGTLSKGGRFIISHLDPMRLLKTAVTNVTECMLEIVVD